jgi:hypothetical protein
MDGQNKAIWHLLSSFVKTESVANKRFIDVSMPAIPLFCHKMHQLGHLSVPTTDCSVSKL